MPSNYTTFTLPYNIEVEIDRERSTAAKDVVQWTFLHIDCDGFG